MHDGSSECGDHPVHITAEETRACDDDRFHRFRLIEWWDQRKLADARILVVGAGALGNEIVKNLALLGVGRVLIADMDRVEHSNLSRSVLFRGSDTGANKAEVAARSAANLYPDIRAHAFVGNVVYDLGLGAFRWADVVIGGLDNREARLAINRACRLVGRPWIDGAIEQIQGTARVFGPDGPCYECTMTDADWRLLQNRRSCNLLTRPEMEGGKTPTTPTISSIIAGVQCQEAVKLLHGLPTIGGHGWVFDGLSTDAYQVTFQHKAGCFSHEPLEEIIALDARSDELTAGALLARARALMGPATHLELGRDVLERLICPQCHREQRVLASMGRVPAEAAFCPECPGVRREVITFHRIAGGEAFLDLPLNQIGVPPFDIVVARGPERSVGFELDGDASLVLGSLIDSEALQWQ